jgi:hypothetical protein
MVLALVAGLVGFAGEAAASDGKRWRTVDITFGVEGYDFPIGEQVCDPAAPTNCVFDGRDDGYTFTGDLVGTGVEVRSASLAPTNIAIVRAVGTFAGTVKGCGSGTFVYTLAQRFELNNNTEEGAYTIAPGTGTGDLEGITGVFKYGSGPVRCRRR